MFLGICTFLIPCSKEFIKTILPDKSMIFNIRVDRTEFSIDILKNHEQNLRKSLLFFCTISVTCFINTCADLPYAILIGNNGIYCAPYRINRKPRQPCSS